ncbi:MAG: Type secretion system pilin [Candidatus Parcubacteria bacterium]|jgi:hypothetical protein
MKKAFVVGSLLMMLLVSVTPSVVAAAGEPAGSGCSSISEHGLDGLVECAISIFNYAIYLMMAASVVYIVYGAFNMISSEEKREAGKQTIYYGIIGLFVMISIWGLVSILANTFGLSDTTSSDVIGESADFINIPKP